MAKSSYRSLLSALRQRLGPDWRQAGASVIFRRGELHLLQGVSCQTSNFDRTYVPASFVQVLAHPADTFTFNFGGRLQKAGGTDYWLSGAEEPPVDDVAALLSEQSWPRLTEPLTLAAVERELDQRPRPKADPHHAWCAGLIFGLRGREENAHLCFGEALTELEELRKSWKRSAASEAQWVREALLELELLQSLLPDPKQFEAHCREVSEETSRHLQIEKSGEAG